MRIIGDGFLAGHLHASIGDRHPDVTAIAAGVSSTWVTDPAAFDREAEMLYQVLAASRRTGQRVLFFSTASSAMYGSTTGPAAEDTPVQPPSVYGRHKLALESVVRSSGVDHLILRLSHLVGTHHPAHHLLPAMVAQISAGKVILHTGAHRDLLDVRDLILAIDTLLAAGVLEQADGPRVLNVASGMPQPIGQIVAGIETRLGVHPQRVERPGADAITQVDLGLLRRLVPQFTLETTAASYLDRILDEYLPFYAPQPAT